MRTIISKNTPESFEQAMSELQEIVHLMQGGNLSLDDSLKAYERGMELQQYCQQTLQSAQERMEKLKNQQNQGTNEGSDLNESI